jgi:hypothetical protein
MNLSTIISQSIRVVATLGIWGFLTVILTSNANTDNTVWLAIVLGVGATISTGFIWTTGQESAEETATKAKRNSRISKMVNRLDDEEVAELADLLIARGESRLVDGERRSQRLSE